MPSQRRSRWSYMPSQNEHVLESHICRSKYMVSKYNVLRKKYGTESNFNTLVKQILAGKGIPTPLSCTSLFHQMYIQPTAQHCCKESHLRKFNRARPRLCNFEANFPDRRIHSFIVYGKCSLAKNVKLEMFSLCKLCLRAL